MVPKSDVASAEILTEREAADVLGVQPYVLAQRRSRAIKGKNPSLSPPWYLTPRGRIRYKRSEILAWKRSREVESEAELRRVDPSAGPEDAST